MQTLQRSIAASDNQFGLSLYRAIAAKQRSDNIIISPLSVAMALQMTANGAAGATRQQMLDTLKTDTLSIDDLNAANADLLKALTTNNKSQILEIANALFVRAGLKLQQVVQEALQRSYNADLKNVDFGKPSALLTINGFVDKNTHGKIPTIVSQTTDDMRVVLVNAVYFKGHWETPFNKSATREETFHANGQDVKVQMMHTKRWMPYAESAEFQAVALPYEGGRTQMVIILPAKEKLDAFESNLDFNKLSEVLDSLSSSEGSLAVPRFKLEWASDLVPTLRELGMSKPFSPQEADFSNMVETGERLFISLVMHKTFMDFNEEGTEAAAATAVGIRSAAVRMEPEHVFNMVCDRPFYIALQDRASGAIIFFGRISKPARV